MREGRRVMNPYRAMDGGLGQGDTEGAVLFNKVLFKSFKLFSPATASFWPSDPNSAGAGVLKLKLTYERSGRAGCADCRGGAVAVNEAVVRAGAGPVP